VVRAQCGKGDGDYAPLWLGNKDPLAKLRQRKQQVEAETMMRVVFDNPLRKPLEAEFCEAAEGQGFTRGQLANLIVNQVQTPTPFHSSVPTRMFQLLSNSTSTRKRRPHPQQHRPSK
jgi:hypothetical protein